MVSSFPPVRAAAAALLAAMLIALAPGPVSAHGDLQVVASAPARGERVAAAPTDVVIQFSEDILTEGAEITIVDGSGHDWAAGATVVPARDTVTVSVEAGMPAAEYEIRWRVVSPDGDPVGDSFRFTVSDVESIAVAAEDTTRQGPPAVDVPAADVPAAEVPAEEISADRIPAGQIPSERIQSEQELIWRTVLFGAAGTVLAAALALVLVVRRRARGPDNGATSKEGL
ncbi:copper resistance protein CopC [Glaciihabitans sp. INWT7]|uniref:copper resistance CopC family protein n=1 Tax=Glaciihabitans sp. INWT7 TaxID=2596912 RepID=UPI0016263FE0|nr:copper resistance CopC family protein [Glaciihabitans sp. INWT7]QNE46679.1 copper resistance protein CopC [Glaciihabitans sp. INWT7]